MINIIEGGINSELIEKQAHKFTILLHIQI